MRVEIGAIASAGGPSGHGQASIDPYITIDPSTPNASLYTLVFSPGIGNGPPSAPAVPEPSTWAMILLGFAGLAFAGRKARGGLRLAA